MSNPFDIFDALSELVYVSDVATYELLYVNESAARMIEGPWQGRTCFEAIQGLDAPCEFCNNGELGASTCVAWTCYNKQSGRHYSFKDGLIDWNGRAARFEVAFDVTEDARQKAVLQNQLGLETLLVDCIMEFRRTCGIEVDPLPALEKIGRFFKAGRVYIVEIDGELMSNTYEWCNEGVDSQIEASQDVPVSYIDRWMDSFKQRDCVIIEDVEQLKGTSPIEYAILKPQGIARLVVAPIYANEELSGYIGVDDPELERLDLSTSFFKTVGMFLSMEVEQSAIREKLRRMSFEDSLTGVWNRNRFIEDVQRFDEAGPKAGFGVMYIDLNGLKDINDREGHAIGDRSLIDAARILDSSFEKSDVYRLGGDEFVVVSLEADKHQFEHQVAEASTRLSARSCPAAIGTFYAEEPCSVDDAVKFADTRMYQDKRRFYRAMPEASRHQSMYGFSDAAT
ncbi:sensor domain-containing diguanylate cyclase [Raoultibacter phocaeensis]|uniref:sensor domain-containing diguanylate cyclase n=1 Tax=Raoultibacter phocaeensis TaxID=2479841 RepID=UPI0015D643AA|nr:sensor domain-containing diguanylate cyclase [Raoultibacter phocaeensis]